VKCPRCGQGTYVAITRSYGPMVIRIRGCSRCRRRFRTEERCTVELPMEQKKQSSVEARRAERERWHKRP
jgi:transcriptional regulator NrdR family protein